MAAEFYGTATTHRARSPEPVQRQPDFCLTQEQEPAPELPPLPPLPPLPGSISPDIQYGQQPLSQMDEGQESQKGGQEKKRKIRMRMPKTLRKGEPGRGLRLSALIPAVFAAATFGLSLVLVVAGISTGQGPDLYLFALDTSRLATRTITLTADPVPDTGNAVVDFFGDILDNITTIIDEGFTSLEADIASRIIGETGIKDRYDFFLRHVCEGKLADEEDFISDVVMENCFRYEDAEEGFTTISNNLYTTLPLTGPFRGAALHIPLLQSLSSTLGTLSNTTFSYTPAIFALLLLTSITSPLLSIISLISIPFPLKPLVLTCLPVSILVFLSLFVAACLASITAHLIVHSTNFYAYALTISAYVGTTFEKVVWSGVAVSVVPLVYWFMIWFVEVRKTSVQRRRRTAEQVGSWRGVWGEVRGDLSLGKKEI